MLYRRFGRGGGDDFSVGGGLVGVSTDGVGEASLWDWAVFLDCGVRLHVERSTVLLEPSISDEVSNFLFRFFFLILPGSAGANINPMSPSIGPSFCPTIVLLYPSFDSLQLGDRGKQTFV